MDQAETMSSSPPDSVTETSCVTLEPVRRGDGTVDWTATRTKLQQAYAGIPLDEEGIPSWQAAYNQLWVQEEEREILNRLQEVDQKGGNVPGMNPAEWASGYQGSPGFLLDEDLALSTPCTRINLGDGHKPLVYSRGIIGALDEAQIARYCLQGFIEEEASPKQRAHLLAMSEAAHTCSLQTREAPPEEHLQLYFTCLGKELKQRGVQP